MRCRFMQDTWLGLIAGFLVVLDPVTGRHACGGALHGIIADKDCAPRMS